jgi:hypothetical protein
MSQKNQLFFALLDEAAAPQTALLRLAQDVQKELTALFVVQRQAFRDPGAELVEYDARYTPDADELLYVSGFVLPEAVKTALANPIGQDPLPFGEDSLVRIRAIFTGVWNESEKWVAIQAFDRRRLISTRGFSLIHAGGTFVRLHEPGLTIDTKLTAVVEDDRLIFRSFDAARRLFDLTEYFREATADDLEKLAAHPRIHIADPAGFYAAADTWTRKKVALVAQSNVLNKCTPHDAARAAKKYGVTLPIQRINGKEKVIFPTAKKEIKIVLRFLDEDYFTSVLTSTRFVTNSKRKV